MSGGRHGGFGGRDNLDRVAWLTGADSELGRPSVVNLGWPPAKSMTCSQLFYGCFNSVSFINECANDVENSIGLVCLPNVFLDMSVPTDAPLIAVQKLKSTRCWQCPS